ncbi:MAG: quinone oxidoreductase [Spirochaetales bacterium]|nr:MAG: quinone oxidoreductase [Spirochaetales bacterium]
MRKIVVQQYGPPEVMQIRHQNVCRPGPGQILIRLKAAGVNPVDTYMRTGSQGYSPSLPFTPGNCGAGIIKETGEGVIGWEAGMKVYTHGTLDGSYGEYCLCAPHQVHPLPKELNWYQGACLGVPYFTAARAVFTVGRIRKRESVLVHGASGAVGLACLQLCAGTNLRVYGTSGSEKGEIQITAAGARHFSHNDKNRFAAIRQANSGGVDLIVEMLANVNLNDDLGLLSPGGRVVIVGSRGKVEISPRDLMISESAIRGVRITNASLREIRGYELLIARKAKEGKVRPPLARVFSLSNAPDAHRSLMGERHSGNIVLDIQ